MWRGRIAPLNILNILKLLNNMHVNGDLLGHESPDFLLFSRKYIKLILQGCPVMGTTMEEVQRLVAESI